MNAKVMTLQNSAQQELQSHLDGSDEAEWLQAKGLIGSTMKENYSIDVIQDWYMPGSESYILDFQIATPERTKRLIAKACIKMCATETVKEWHNRRYLIQESGIAVPVLYSTHRATYIEEYIPFNLRQAYDLADGRQRSELQVSFVDTYTKLGALGFNPLSLYDVRSRGEDIVLIDFGFDLGAATPSSPSSRDFTSQANVDFKRIIR